MCGITGILAFNEIGRINLANLEKATHTLAHRGPDNQGIYSTQSVGLGHQRLSIIDTSSNGNQPFQILDGRYVITFNGEIFNYQKLRKELLSKGIQFKSDSDTEVLLHLFAQEGKDCFNKLNGFFAFAIYDSLENSLFIARDRLGIKPLLYFYDDSKFLFGSEMNAMLSYDIEKEIDQEALNYYLQLNYTPSPLTMLRGVKKLEPGHYMTVQNGQISKHQYYDVPNDNLQTSPLNYHSAKTQLQNLLEKSVERRMIADVPLGCFLSGGIDSSVITSVASGQTQSLKTFSIGFEENHFFDETHYAELVAQKFKTDHTTFKLTNEEITNHLSSIIDHIDEPFADSSAIPVYLLSKKTREHVTVALSGDGADEIFSGYNKHSAWWKMENNWKFKTLISLINPVAHFLPKSRSGALSNAARQVERFANAMKMNATDRYWFLASFTSQTQVNQLLKHPLNNYSQRNSWMEPMTDVKSINDLLRLDTKFVLPNDMLKKVDLMSMANSLEVRVPFLDHELVDFVFSLPESMKLNGSIRKKILQDTYRSILPVELYNRPKKGFEIPLLDWLKTSLSGELNEHLFDKEKIISQGLFNWSEIERLKKQLFSRNPEDTHARVWGLYVFQKWHSKYL
ncbi:asparagine synthase (glutamine-hydrolysing) [Reichenbachiella faecimaris]|uniref:asparagine synthase (glutamine-hydrolyzing) n=1 Tax=Reichenbachiella faecimaris TaxID=692418 RepID=A0A1W2GDI9_REIFA|nr:asparagine synthase (glutamine-hydrolyzing) [Reichenbachiella faecimaris]SMD34388.1 asparagine synthase (glutamine-hydrolysing) [Reichenbachiella faecimaris]